MTEQQTKKYREALAEARSQFQAATKRLTEIEYETHMLNGEVSRLRRTITALSAMCSELPGFDDLGITEFCIEVMENEPGIVTTADVVKALEQMGFDLASQKNVSASVHSVLSRLARKGKIAKVTDLETEVVSWKGPHYDPDYNPDLDIPF